ncbi:uncharacterized protein SPPG_00626 [Spizellomyces punctatus DAOM BR117]|uniref:HCP-like protein n=1 Tax=Spizellomyces punctatus (strain DAOM BR117) TaxID=645134 RepID=A0A0L0HUA2_SPIPD|nr:uncharacterized protein SPPG_00626 [Spizellomyces punctatus DAOM BR117]KND04936.1 hypothetical protein SPPG_00626 [Spizellomyces punctatus DAOM BR117]|eukprot:XP_016612975.1 hypothetical protein SPPG_00626 [Spizellomyces punctatus DAOM BR117]
MDICTQRSSPRVRPRRTSNLQERGAMHTSRRTVANKSPSLANNKVLARTSTSNSLSSTSSISSSGSTASTEEVLADFAVRSRSSRQALYIVRRLQALKRAADAANPLDHAPAFAYAKYILDHATRLEFDQYAYVQDALAIIKDLASGPSAYPPAQLVRANILLSGPPCQDPSKPILQQRDNEGAFRLYMSAAKADIPDAAYRAAMMIQNRRVPWGGDMTESIRLLNMAAKHNHPGALYALAKRLLGSGSRKDLVKGIEYLRLSAATATKVHPEALHDLALIYRDGLSTLVAQDPTSALNLLLDAADLKHAPSQHLLATAYLSPTPSLGITTPNPALAVHYCSLAAKASFPPAMLSLSKMYLTGMSTPTTVILSPDPAEAYLLARKAAEKGLASAQCLVGRFVEEGQCVKCMDPTKEATLWYKRAADQGNREARMRLSRLEGRP